MVVAVVRIAPSGSVCGLFPFSPLRPRCPCCAAPAIRQSARERRRSLDRHDQPPPRVPRRAITLLMAGVARLCSCWQRLLQLGQGGRMELPGSASHRRHTAAGAGRAGRPNAVRDARPLRPISSPAAARCDKTFALLMTRRLPGWLGLVHGDAIGSRWTKRQKICVFNRRFEPPSKPGPRSRSCARVDAVLCRRA